MAGAGSGAVAGRGGGEGGRGRGAVGAGGGGAGGGPRPGGGRKTRPRHSQLMRAAPADKAARAQVLAANLDLVVIVVPCPPRPTVIDRFLAIATRGGTPRWCVRTRSISPIARSWRASWHPTGSPRSAWSRRAR